MIWKFELTPGFLKFQPKVFHQNSIELFDDSSKSEHVRLSSLSALLLRQVHAKIGITYTVCSRTF